MAKSDNGIGLDATGRISNPMRGLPLRTQDYAATGSMKSGKASNGKPRTLDSKNYDF